MSYRESSAARRHVSGVPLHVIGLFEAARMMIDGQPQRAIAIRCGRCRITETMRMRSFPSSGGEPSVEQENRAAARKFSKAGWIVGITASRHRCPKCQPQEETMESSRAEGPDHAKVVQGFERWRIADCGRGGRLHATAEADGLRGSAHHLRKIE